MHSKNASIPNVEQSGVGAATAEASVDGALQNCEMQSTPCPCPSGAMAAARASASETFQGSYTFGSELTGQEPFTDGIISCVSPGCSMGLLPTA